MLPLGAAARYAVGMSDASHTPLAHFLAENDVPCPNPKCGFNLRGLKDATCPECHEPLSLSVRRTEALWYIRKWVVGTVMCLAMSGLIGAALRILNYLSGGMGYFRWDDWVYLAVDYGVAIAWPITLGIYFHGARRRSPSALPRLLLSLTIGLSLICSIYILLGAWHLATAFLFGPW